MVIETDMNHLMKTFEKVSYKFGEDPETFKWEDLFLLLIQFNDVFQVSKSIQGPYYLES